MPDQNVPTPSNGHLTPSGRRALAAAMLQTADPTLPPALATAIVDVLDATAAATLAAVAVLSPAAARAVLSTLWQNPAVTA